jgi:uncharacterized glyoxalase superfamily protein PhnB
MGQQAIEFYQKALGAKVEQSQTFGDVDGSCPEARRHLVMHAVLRFGKTACSDVRASLPGCVTKAPRSTPSPLQAGSAARSG